MVKKSTTLTTTPALLFPLIVTLIVIFLNLSLIGSVHGFLVRAGPKETIFHCKNLASESSCAIASTRKSAKSLLMSSSSRSTSSASAAKEDVATDQAISINPPKKTILRVLAFHGSGGNAASFTRTMATWNDFLAPYLHHHHEFDFSAVDGPVSRDGGLAWWSMPPFVRSFNATTYTGFDESTKIVHDQLTAMSESSPSSSDGTENKERVDVVLGHSQGAILITALLALEKIPYPTLSPRIGYILNGVAWPNPFTQQLESLRLPPLPPANDVNINNKGYRRVLILIGRADFINPPQQAYRVQTALQAAGFDVTVIEHAGGHAVPIPSQQNINETMQKIMNWIAQGI